MSWQCKNIAEALRTFPPQEKSDEERYTLSKEIDPNDKKGKKTKFPDQLVDKIKKAYEVGGESEINEDPVVRGAVVKCSKGDPDGTACGGSGPKSKERCETQKKHCQDFLETLDSDAEFAYASGA